MNVSVNENFRNQNFRDVSFKSSKNQPDNPKIVNPNQGSLENMTDVLDALGSIGKGIAAVNSKNNPDEQQILKEKEQLENAGFNVEINPDKTLTVSVKDSSGMQRVGISLLKNVSEINGNVEIYNDSDQLNVKREKLTSINGDVRISGFNDECRETDAANWGYACFIDFPNLKNVGNLTVSNSACYLHFAKLSQIDGTFTVDSSCESDNRVYLPKISEVKGDFNIQKGTVETSPAIFNAVDGKLNAIPPESYESYLIVSDEKSMYESIYIFTNTPEIIKKDGTYKK